MKWIHQGVIVLRNVRWLYSWHKIGLDTDVEAFDIILMTHPASVKKLPKVGTIGEMSYRMPPTGVC